MCHYVDDKQQNFQLHQLIFSYIFTFFWILDCCTIRGLNLKNS